VTHHGTIVIAVNDLVLVQRHGPQCLSRDSNASRLIVAPGASVTVVITGTVSLHATERVMSDTVTFTTDEGWNGGAGVDLELDLPVGDPVYPVNRGGMAVRLTADMLGILVLLTGGLYLALAAKRRIQSRR